jgi:hypothetical protein
LQLYIYGFVKIESGSGLGACHHLGFLRSDKSLLLSFGRNQCDDRRCKHKKQKTQHQRQKKPVVGSKHFDMMMLPAPERPFLLDSKKVSPKKKNLGRTINRLSGEKRIRWKPESHQSWADVVSQGKPMNPHKSQRMKQ